ncbi:MAG: hypothetical protein C4K58_05810 [Flavobacteriaceae bacterium]|nr:MAG: hypothetical protein C4K58_05810 [Flavobacteriaceae bacterium]
MKKILSLFLLLGFSIGGFAQKSMLKNEYTLVVENFPSTVEKWESVPKENNANSLSILTYNLGILRFKVPFKTLDLVPYTRQRLEKLPEILLNSGADVLCLQEVFEEKDKQFLIGNLSKEYPFATYVSRRGLTFGLDDGMMVFSKYPILTSEYHPYKSGVLLEKIAADKGTLQVEVFFQNQSVFFFNNHTTAGGGVHHSESKRADFIRQKQIDQMLDLAKAKQENHLVFICGDFNAGPQSPYTETIKEASKENYQSMIDAGFVDTFPLGCKDKSCDRETWDKESFLNLEGGYFPSSADQKIDHILINKNFVSKISSFQSEVIFYENSLTIEGNKLTPSDHNGVKTTLIFK